MVEICYDTARVGACASAPITISGRMEIEAARALDAVGQLAQIAWWDGSAIGLRLSGFISLLGGIESDIAIETQDEQA